MSDLILKGRSVVITGAGSGVGRAASELFSQSGARVICADIQAEWLNETVQRITAAGGEARGVRCDVTDRAQVQSAVNAAVEAYGRLDVMYNNAGIASPVNAAGRSATFGENTDEQIERLLSVNVVGAIHGCQAALARFREQGGGGVIVNTASIAGLAGGGGVLYSCTKGAVIGLTRALAIEVAKEDIRVNSVCPGTMVTHFGLGASGALSDDMLSRLAKFQPLGRIVDPREVAQVALFLASDAARNITGVNIPVDGGATAGRATASS